MSKYGNLLHGHQEKLNEHKQGEEVSPSHIDLVQSVVHSSHTDLSKYGYFTTQSVTQHRGNVNQLFLCKLFDIKSSIRQAMNRP